MDATPLKVDSDSKYVRSTAKYQAIKKSLDRKPVSPPIPQEVIDTKLRLIEIAMQLGDEEDAIYHCKCAFLEGQPLECVASMSLAELGISTRTTNALEKRGVYTLSDILRFGYDAIERIPYLGKQAVHEVRKALAEHGY